MFSPTGVVTYAYGPRTAGCVPYWMVAATAATSAAASEGRSPIAGGQVPGAVQPDSPARIPVASNSTYPPSAAAYHGLLKRTAQLNELLYPSVIPLPGTLTADNASPTAVRGSGPQGLRPNQDMPRTIHEPSDQRTGRDLKSHELSSLRRSGHPLSPSAVKSKDLKFGIDRILHQSRSNEDSSKVAESEKPDGPRSTDSTIVRRPISKNPVLQSPVLTPPRSSYCSTAYGNAEPGIGRSLSPNRECHRPRMMSPHASHLPLNGHLVAQSMAAAAGYHHHFRPEYAGHLPSMIGHNPHQIQASQQHHHQEQSLPKRKRSWSRAVFSHLQRKGLEKRFEVQKYVTKPDRRQLAAMLGLTDAQVKVWFQNRRMKWRHAEEAKRKKEEEDKQDKTQNVSGVVNVEINSKHRDITDICLKSDDENDNGDEGEKFEYSFDDDPQHDELVVDEVSSDEDDEHGVHMVRYSSSEEHNKIDTSIYNIDKCESD